jgi:hypothetical protein
VRFARSISRFDKCRSTFSSISGIANATEAADPVEWFIASRKTVMAGDVLLWDPAMDGAYKLSSTMRGHAPWRYKSFPLISSVAGRKLDRHGICKRQEHKVGSKTRRKVCTRALERGTDASKWTSLCDPRVFHVHSRVSWLYDSRGVETRAEVVNFINNVDHASRWRQVM